MRREPSERHRRADSEIEWGDEVWRVMIESSQAAVSERRLIERFH